MGRFLRNLVCFFVLTGCCLAAGSAHAHHYPRFESPRRGYYAWHGGYALPRFQVGYGYQGRGPHRHFHFGTFGPYRHWAAPGGCHRGYCDDRLDLSLDPPY